LGKRREEKTQHEIQIKSFQNFSPTQNTAGIQERCRCVFKMINGNEKLFFSVLAYVLLHTCVHFHFILMSRQKPEPLLPFYVLITTLDFGCSLPHQFKEIKSAELPISLIGVIVGK
jgi:hypothetical protein